MAYADVLVTAEVNSCIRCNFRCFATVSGKIPTLVSSFFYSVQLAYVYCVGIGFACFYIGNLTCMVKGYATINYGLSTIQYYRSTCTILHASSTIGNSKSCIAIFQQQSSSVKANSFITIANGFDILQLIFQLYFYISTIIAYFDIVVAAEVNSCIRCNFSRGFVTVCRKVPTLVSSFFYSVQLAYVYCVGISFACFYIGNLTCMVKGYATINYGLSTIQYYRSTCTILHASSTIGNSKSCIAIFQQQSSSVKANSFITIANGFDILQLIFQLYFYISTIIAYFDIVVAAEVNSCIRCNFSRGFVTVCRKVPTLVSSFFYSVQLAAVYCFFGICRNFAVCYTGNLAILVNGNLVVKLDAIICKADAACAFASDGLNASQLVFQRNANFITIIAYLNVSIAIKFNCIARFYIRCIAILSFQLPTLACASSSFTYLLQLCYVYCVSISSTCCYIGNLTSNFFTLYRTAYRNSTISCLPSNTGFSFSSTIAYHFGSSVSYAANAQSNAAFYAYACTIANSNCIISRNRILMTEGNNIAYAVDCVFVTHYNRIGNVGQFIVGTCHEYIMTDIFRTTDKPVVITDNGRIGLFGNSVGTADYCNGTALLFSENRIVAFINTVCFLKSYTHILIGIGNLITGTLNSYAIRSLNGVCRAHNIIGYTGINKTVVIIYSILRADNSCRCTLNIDACNDCIILSSVTVNNRISTYNSSIQATGICISTYKSSAFATTDSIRAQRGSFIAGMCFIAKSYTA